MSWKQLAPPARLAGNTARKHSPVFAICRQKGRFAAALRITVRRGVVLPVALPWWTRGASVAVMLGEGADAGKLRIAPDVGGAFELVASGPRGGVSLALTDFPGLPDGKRGQTKLDFTIGPEGSFLVVDLPDWVTAARPAAHAAEVAAPAEADTAAPEAFRECRRAEARARVLADPIAHAVPGAPVERPKALAPVPPVQATRETIRKWAGERGLASHADPQLDMKAINAKRRALGLPEFEVVR